MSTSDDGGVGARLRLTELRRKFDEPSPDSSWRDDEEPLGFGKEVTFRGSAINFPLLQDVKTGRGTACRVTSKYISENNNNSKLEMEFTKPDPPHALCRFGWNNCIPTQQLAIKIQNIT